MDLDVFVKGFNNFFIPITFNYFE